MLITAGFLKLEQAEMMEGEGVCGETKGGVGVWVCGWGGVRKGRTDKGGLVLSPCRTADRWKSS